MGILGLPGEVTRLIVQHLDPDDLLHLALCHSHLQYIIRDQYICRTALQNHTLSLEYEEALRVGDYAWGLRRLAKRRDAVRNAQPFQVVRIADATHFMYAHGALCYTTSQAHLRVLRLESALLSGPVSRELVIDIPILLSPIFPAINLRPGYTFKPLHHAQHILSCLFTFQERLRSKTYLIVCDIQQHRVIGHRHIPDPRGLFVRNNANYLYYGTRSEPGADRVKRWVLRGLDLERGDWLSTRLILQDFAGTEIGSDICFEILDGYLYCLSNQEMVEPGETVHNSFYYALRFRLDDFQENSTTKASQKIVMWRRQPREGPVDDRWNTLEICRDEDSGRPFIVETRKELLSAVSQSLRTSYKMELVFPAQQQPLDTPYDSDDDDYDDDDDDWGDETLETQSPHILHYGDEELSPIALTFSHVFARSYNSSCRTFVDLVNSPPTSGETTSPINKRLRLRCRPQLTGPQARQSASYVQHLLSQNRDHEVRFWPPSSHPLSESLYEILNPVEHFDSVDSATDERFIVYSPKSWDNACEARPLVLVSFDPALHLIGLEGLHGHCDAAPPRGRKRIRCEDAVSIPVAKQTKPLLPSWITRRRANYITPIKGAPRGFDMSRKPCHLS